MKFQLALCLATLGLAVKACLLPFEIDGTLQHSLDHTWHRRAAVNRRSESESSPATNFTEFPIGRGDRFRRGRRAPHGVGGADRNMTSILNVREIRSGLLGLAHAYDDVKLFVAPYRTFESRRLYGVTVGNRPRVFIQSGVHARERGGPDFVLYFVADLLAARAEGSGVRYGSQTYTNEQVRTALSAGIVLLPVVNPDGVVFDQRTNSCWRKNRNTKSALGSLSNRNSSAGTYRRVNGTVIDPSVGVDLNRNFAFMWDFRRLFDTRPGGNGRRGAAVSDDPGKEVFHGTAPLSEPETRNVAWLLRRHHTLSWFLDLHSLSGRVLYGWSDDDIQTTDPRQNFANASYDGLRGHIEHGEADDSTARKDGDSRAASAGQYGEFMEAADLRAEESAARRIADAMSRAGPLPYRPGPTASLYPAGGTAIDQALGPYYARECGAYRVHGLTVEFGDFSDSEDCPFYPDAAAYHHSMRQVAAGLMELLLTAAGPEGERKVYRCPKRRPIGDGDGALTR
ncbi:hypothetical protein CDD83_8063 [Cordyceps sp. RAO-2017]|nr:hypothetical protein CDD83_8063 [Cordyceps sp. RAO-2017]